MLDCSQPLYFIDAKKASARAKRKRACEQSTRMQETASQSRLWREVAGALAEIATPPFLQEYVIQSTNEHRNEVSIIHIHSFI